MGNIEKIHIFRLEEDLANVPPDVHREIELSLDIGKAIIDALKTKGLSTLQLAKRLGYHPAFMYAHTSGMIPVKYDTLIGVPALTLKDLWKIQEEIEVNLVSIVLTHSS